MALRGFQCETGVGPELARSERGGGAGAGAGRGSCNENNFRVYSCDEWIHVGCDAKSSLVL